MVVPESRLCCRLDGLSQSERSQQRSSSLQDLGLLDSEGIPLFEELVQTAAHFAAMPMAVLSIVHGDQERLKATFGLAHLGLMNDLIRSRSIDVMDSYGTHVVDSHQALVIEDTHDHPAFAQSLLAQEYGIRSYIGVPLVTSQGQYVGVLSVWDKEPRTLGLREIEFLMMTARFGMSEYERLQTLRLIPRSTIVPLTATASSFASEEPNEIAEKSDPALSIPLKFKLVAHLTQELRTPLTSVMGMASVLNREIYGPLTVKQREYLGIIHHSGEYLLSLVKEILELSQLDLEQQDLNLTPVDVEMLCQQAIATLHQAAQRREQEIRLTVEPGNRIWVLDKEKMRQLLYHLIFSVVQASNAGSIVHLHAANKLSGLRLTLWVTHPCLEGAGFSQGSDLLGSDEEMYESSDRLGVMLAPSPTAPMSPEVGIQESLAMNLGFLLSQQLVGLHGGEIKVQGHALSGYRYSVTVPRLTL
jgi:signal transduction histidine kinase